MNIDFHFHAGAAVRASHHPAANDCARFASLEFRDEKDNTCHVYLHNGYLEKIRDAISSFIENPCETTHSLIVPPAANDAAPESTPSS